MSLAGVLLTLVCLLVSASFPRAAVVRRTGSNAVDHGKDDAVNRLLKVFGLKEPARKDRHHAPPQYMLQLYKTIAGNSGITRTTSPYYANVIRSFPDKVRRKRGRKRNKVARSNLGSLAQNGRNSSLTPTYHHTTHYLKFFFNVTPGDSEKEEVLEAEFRVYKLKPKRRKQFRAMDAKSNLLEVRLYQIMPGGTPHSEENNRLLDDRRITYASVGWEVFYVKAAVVDWLRDPQKNLGLMMSVRTASGTKLEDGGLRFAKRHQGHVNKQPILVIYSDDGRPRHDTHFPQANFHDYGYPELSFYSNLDASRAPSQQNVSHESSAQKNRHYNGTDPRGRSARSTPLGSPASSSGLAPSGENPGSCTRHELYVDFEKIGWSTWIISPLGYNAFHCKGECTFPLGQNQWPTNHATVQSIVHELSLSPGVGTPCCVPNKLYSINLLYFDENENVILKQYDDMVAASCGCH